MRISRDAARDFVIRATGDEPLPDDFEGSAEWTLEPVLRPLFRSNHTWAMRHGERQIREYLDTP